MDINDIYNYSVLLRIPVIRDELEGYIKGFSFQKIDHTNNKITCTLINERREVVYLSISQNEVSLFISRKTSVERINIYDNLIVGHKKVERRLKGIIYSDVIKRFSESKKYDGIILSEIEENRLVFTKDSLERQFQITELNYEGLMKLLIKFKLLSLKSLKNSSDYSSSFRSTLKYNKNTDSYYQTTLVNDENVSKLYDPVIGEYEIYRIYDLFRGIISPKNEFDMEAIFLGNLSPDSFGLNELLGISKNEITLIGRSLEFNEEYIMYLKDFLKENYNNGEMKMDRMFLLEAITGKILINQVGNDIRLLEDDTTGDRGIRRLLKIIFSKKNN